MRRFALYGAALVGAGAAGAAVAVGVVAAAGDLGSSSTTVRELLPEVAAERSPAFASAQPLTIHDVYARDAPGVVQVTATSRVAVQSNPFLDPFGFGGTTETQQALGSGFVIDVGSSRVDLQACKLEYSIVSPK